MFRDPRGGVHLDAEREEGLGHRARDGERRRTGAGSQRTGKAPGPPRSGPAPTPAARLSTLVRANRLHGADPGPLTASARWRRERDVPDDVWFRATEAGL